ncbi:MAG: diguanylate cyclase [Acidobacteria bacterium]|nr:diguanylate cyclase [Acidobacteriota bacterium]
MANSANKNFLSNKKLLILAIAVLLIPAVGALFYRFGPEIAIVLVPIAIGGAFGYQTHLKRLAQKTREITEASRIHLATVEALATAIDARDQRGIGHVGRTQIYAVGLGRVLGLNTEDIGALRTAALLHGIGKLAIPDHILNKPGNLTPAELEKARRHSNIGASILEKVGFQGPVVPAVKHHAERWDGKGYPDALAGEAIPLTARILAVAAAFDTLRGARPYREALTREKARKIIQSEAGTRFDPRIVNALIKNLSRFESEIAKRGLDHDGIAESAPSDNHYVEQIKMANREVFSLYELAREFGGSMELDETLGLFAQKIGEFVPFDTCAVYLMHPGASEAAVAFASGENADDFRMRRIRAGQGATGYALKKRETTHNVDPDLDFSYSLTKFAGRYKTLASVPLLAENELVGAVTIYAHQISEYGEEHIRLLETISRIAAEAIGKSLQHDEAKTHALTDPMTGLPNARSLQAQFEKEAARAGRSGSSFQLIMLDLDGFKAVNDNYGHKKGDEMLREISKVIRKQLRDYDFLARYGGDEFVALIPDAVPDDVADLCTRIENAVSDFKLDVGGGHHTSVGVSLGAAAYPQSGQTLDQMVVSADKAMYSRKVSRKRARLTGQPNSGFIAPAPAFDESLIIELDESHVMSAAVN